MKMYVFCNVHLVPSRSADEWIKGIFYLALLSPLTIISSLNIGRLAKNDFIVQFSAIKTNFGENGVNNECRAFSFIHLSLER